MPGVVARRLALDAAALWLGVRIMSALAGTGLLPSARQTAVIVLVTALLCLLQVKRFRETDLLRNLGVSRAHQVGLALVVAGGAEVSVRLLLMAADWTGLP